MKQLIIIEVEYRIEKQVRKDMFKAIDREKINSVYHQARIWNRFHYFYGKACSYERYQYLNEKFKKIRREALKAIGESNKKSK